jgi:hypothetical protein
MGGPPRSLSQPTKSDRCCLELGHTTTQLFQSCRESWVSGNHHLFDQAVLAKLPLRVMASNALTEQMFSGFTPKAYMLTSTARRLEIGQGIVIQASNLEAGNLRYELSDDE